MHHETVLTGYGLSLIPLAPQHAEALYDFVGGTMWAGMAAPLPATTGELAALFEARISDPASLAFAVTDRRTGAILGTTALNAFDAGQQRAEVGGTFFGRQFWGSHVNPASKHALLSFAFGVLRVQRVAFRCDARNLRSAAAIERLGARSRVCSAATAPRLTAPGRIQPYSRSCIRNGHQCSAAFSVGWSHSPKRATCQIAPKPGRKANPATAPLPMPAGPSRPCNGTP